MLCSLDLFFLMNKLLTYFFFFQAEDGIRDLVRSRGLGDVYKRQVPDLTSILPIFGTVGLILIVLEGSLELEFNKSKASLIKKSFITAFFPMAFLAILLSILFQYFGQYSFRDSLINAIPFCIISSAIAIPSVKSLSTFNKEFATVS